EELDHEAGRDRKAAAAREPHQRQHEAERNTERERRRAELQGVDEAGSEEICVCDDRREVPAVHREATQDPSFVTGGAAFGSRPKPTRNSSYHLCVWPLL